MPVATLFLIIQLSYSIPYRYRITGYETINKRFYELFAQRIGHFFLSTNKATAHTTRQTQGNRINHCYNYSKNTFCDHNPIELVMNLPTYKMECGCHQASCNLLAMMRILLFQSPLWRTSAWHGTPRKIAMLGAPASVTMSSTQPHRSEALRYEEAKPLHQLCVGISTWPAPVDVVGMITLPIGSQIA
jgi:hypothetical protein